MLDLDKFLLSPHILISYTVEGRSGAVAASFVVKRCKLFLPQKSGNFPGLGQIQPLWA